MKPTQSDVLDDEMAPSGDLGDPVQVKERNKRIRQRERELADTYVQIMSTKQGRSWMHHLIYDKCGYDKKQFTGNSATYANVGVLEIGQMIVRELKALCFEQWALMEREAMEKRSAD